MKANPAAVVRHLLAVQSQDYAGAVWALGQRLTGWTEASLGTAFDEGAFARTHVLRPTWHFVAPEDLRWLLALTGPRLRRSAAHRHRSLDIYDDLALRSLGIFERALSRAGSLTRRELRGALAEEGIDAAGGRLAHLVMVAEYEALLCSGPRKGAEQTYALVDQRIAPARPRERDEALAELAARYVRGRGPVQDIDLAWWSGLSRGDARRGLAGAGAALERTELHDGRTFWSADAVSLPRPAVRTAHLLPNYDELLVAMRDRREATHPDLPAEARTPENIFNDVIVVDGQVVGQWDRPAPRTGTRLGLRPRVALDGEARALVDAAVDGYATFLGRSLVADWLD